MTKSEAYAAWLDREQAIIDNETRQNYKTEQRAHYYWQRLADRRTMDGILRDIRGEADVPWEYEPITDTTPDPEPPPVVEVAPPASGAWNIGDALRIRTDFLGRWSRPLFMYGGMADVEKREQWSWMDQHGYTTVPFPLHNNYPAFPHWHWDLWDDPGRFAVDCGALLDAGKIPLVVLHPRPGLGMREHLANVRSVWSTIQRTSPVVMWGWEINDLGGDWANGDRQLDYLRELHKIVGDTPILVHFTPERWAGWPGFDGKNQDKGEIDWLRRAKDLGVVGLCYQDAPSKPLDAVLERALQIPSPFHWSPGIAGRVVEGAGLAFYMFEFSRDEARHAEAVKALATDARVAGWA